MQSGQSAYRFIAIILYLLYFLALPFHVKAEHRKDTAGKVLTRLAASSPAARLFSSELQALVNIDLARGPIIRSAQAARSSFLFEEMDTVTGRVVTHTYDFAPAETTLSVDRLLRKIIEKSGFETTYECKGLLCGDALGWQFMLSDLNQGTSDTQSYQLLASRPLGEYFQEYLQFYWNQTGCCPRLTVRAITVESMDSEKSWRRWLSESSSTRRLAYFDTGMAVVRPEFHNLLESFALAVQNSDKPLHLVLQGYTDETGSAAANQRLAKKRAESIRSALIDKGIDVDRNTLTIEQQELKKQPEPKAQTETKGWLINRKQEVDSPDDRYVSVKVIPGKA
jgi:outer membrane protein OmpA-like peptidoglycan-associated protein